MTSCGTLAYYLFNKAKFISGYYEPLRRVSFVVTASAVFPALACLDRFARPHAYYPIKQAIFIIGYYERG